MHFIIVDPPSSEKRKYRQTILQFFFIMSRFWTDFLLGRSKNELDLTLHNDKLFYAETIITNQLF